MGCQVGDGLEGLFTETEHGVDMITACMAVSSKTNRILVIADAVICDHFSG